MATGDKHSDGRALEALVRVVEEIFLPAGCKVESRKLVYGESGAQLAELDVVVTGRLGSTEMRWLIECRDRPSEGRAPTAWIMQLAGTRDLHGFNKVTAVSTTGFADGAIEAAKKLGIETRTVSDIAAEDVASWLAMEALTIQHVVGTLIYARINLSENVPDGCTQAFKTLKSIRLRSIRTGVLADVRHAFHKAINQAPGLIHPDSIPEGGKEFRLRVTYSNDDDHYVIDTSAGPARVRDIVFEGKLEIMSKDISAAELKSYSGTAGEVISQSAFYPVELEGRPKMSVELHNLPATGETVLVLRQV